MDFKIALQGGGAKLLTLLSAIDGIQRVAGAEDVSFAEISGASAGSIAGLVLALDLPVERLRSELPAEKIERILTELQPPSIAGLLVKLTRQRPVYSEEIIAKLVSQILRLAGHTDPQKPVILKYPLTIAITDIHNHEIKFVDVQNQPLSFIIDTIVDSCAIPIVLRNHTNQKRADLADGGLFENFPVSRLCDGFEIGRVIGVTFEKRFPSRDFAETADWGLFQYIGNVISTAIDANITASTRQLSYENIITLPSDFETLDFRLAIKRMYSEDKRHQEVSDIAASAFKSIVARERQVEEKQEWEGKVAVPFSYNQLRDACGALLRYRQSSGLNIDCSVYLELNSQCAMSDPAYRNGLDFFYQKAVYEVPEDGIECIEVVISEYETEVEFSMYADFLLRDDAGKKIDAVVFPVRRSEEAKGFRSLGVFLAKRIYPSDSKFLVMIQRELVRGQFESIDERGWDFLEYSSTKDNILRSVKIAVGIPK